MPSNSNRRRRRALRDDRSPQQVFNPEVEERERRVRELQEQLLQKDRSIEKHAMRLGYNSVNVEIDSGPESYFEENDGHMSPIRIDVSGGRSQSSSSANSYLGSPRQNYQRNYQHPGNQFEAPRRDASSRERYQFQYDHPSNYQQFETHQPHFYHEDQDVKVDEIPKWPMHNSPSPHDRDFSDQSRSFSPTPIWRHQQDVQVDPMPIFPMDGGSVEEPKLGREQKVRIQMMMIAHQAELAEIESRNTHNERVDEAKRKADREREEKRKARHEIARIRDKVLQEKRDKEREADTKRRDAERDKRRAQRRKDEEEASAKRRSERRKAEDFTKQAEADEYFLKYLIPAIGNLDCQSSRIEGKSPTEYVSKCHAVNIPKEILYGSKIAETKGESYKGAITNYVDKLVALQIVDSRTREKFKQIERLPKFVAELIDPLCNDISIYGTTISVNDPIDMRSKFETFAKDKSLEFWNKSDNKRALDDFIRKHDRKRRSSRSHSRDRDRKRNDSSRQRSSSRERRPKSPPPASEEQLKTLFATAGNGITSAATNVPNQIPLLQPVSSNYLQQQPNIPSLLTIPLYSPPQPPVMMGSFMQPSSVGFPPQPTIDHLQTNVYVPYQQHIMMQQPGFPNQQSPMVPRLPPTSSQEDDAALMDEVFTC